MKTFPHINFNTMNTLYTKCKQIIEDLDNMIPEDTEASDWYKIEKTKPSTVNNDERVIASIYGESLGYRVGKSLDLHGFTLTGFNDDVISYSHIHWDSSYRINDPDHPRNKVLKEPLQEFLDYRSDNLYSRVHTSMLDYKDLPLYSYHKTTYDTCKKILEALQSESCVNTLNLELVAALQFIEELEESDWKVGLKTYDKDLVEAELEDLKQKVLDEAEEECKNNYETQISEFKAKLEVLEETPKKPEEESDERHREDYPSIWESLKNMFK